MARLGSSDQGAPVMQRLKVRIAAAAIAAGLASIALPAAAQSYYTVNGQPPLLMSR